MTKERPQFPYLGEIAWIWFEEDEKFIKCEYTESGWVEI